MTVSFVIVANAIVKLVVTHNMLGKINMINKNCTIFISLSKFIISILAKY